MKISAIDIRKHTFEKIFRGYDPDEVDAFLNSLSQEWERFASENSLLKMQLEVAERELSKLKDIESTLFRTLKAAEDTSRLIEKEAHEAAEKRIEESKIAANDLVAEAENRTGRIIQETEDRLKRFKEEFAAEVKIQERDFRAIENFRDNLIVQLSSLANSTIETVERFEGKYDKTSVLNRMDEIRKHVAEIEIPKRGYVPPVPIELPAPEEHQEEPEVEVVLSDDKPEVTFEIPVETEPIAVADRVEEVIAVTEVAEQQLPEVKPASVIENETPKPAAVVEEKPEPKVTEPAKDNGPAVNKFRTPDNRPQDKGIPKKPGSTGGSFFDQI